MGRCQTRNSCFSKVADPSIFVRSGFSLEAGSGAGTVSSSRSDLYPVFSGIGSVILVVQILIFLFLACRIWIWLDLDLVGSGSGRIWIWLDLDLDLDLDLCNLNSNSQPWFLSRTK